MAGWVLVSSGGSEWRGVADVPWCAQSVIVVPHRQVLEGK